MGFWRNLVHSEETPLSAAEIVEVMDKVGVDKVVDLDGRWGNRLREVTRTYRDPYPDRFVIFGEDAVDQGAQDFKVWKDLGLKILDTERKRVPLTDPRLTPIQSPITRMPNACSQWPEYGRS